jgi:uncharacterized protein
MMNHLIRGVFLKVCCPFAFGLGWLFRIKKERLQKSMININNRLVLNSGPAKVKNLLLLLPHCLQNSECKIRITRNIYNCESCGKCVIKDFTQLAKEINLDLFVATGGTIARRIVDDTKSDAIVAVACERDLIGGLIDTYPLPVLGVTNERPFGPCFNTSVDIEKVKDAIRFFAGKGSA